MSMGMGMGMGMGTGHSPFAFASCSSHKPERCAAAALWRATSVVTPRKANPRAH